MKSTFAAIFRTNSAALQSVLVGAFALFIFSFVSAQSAQASSNIVNNGVNIVSESNSPVKITLDPPPPPVTVQFSQASQTVNASAGAFSIPVALTGTPGTTVTTFASYPALNMPVGLAFDTAGNLYVAILNDNIVSKVTPVDPEFVEAIMA